MCFSKPKAPQVQAPAPPVEEKIIDLNPDKQKGTEKRTKRQGTRGLQIALGGPASNSPAGLKIPT